MSLTEQDEFEAWYKLDVGENLADLRKESNGTYCVEDAQACWEGSKAKAQKYVLYGYATPSGKLYASSSEALSNGEQSWVKVYVNKGDLKS